MKKLLLLPLALVVLAVACSKNETPGINTAPVKSQPAAFLDPKIKYIYWMVGHNLHCVPPAENCIEDLPNGWDIKFTELDSAIQTGNVKDYFNTAGWEDNFPYLENEPEVVHGLQTGAYTMVRKTNEGDDTECFYVVINATEDPDNYDQAILVVNIKFQ